MSWPILYSNILLTKDLDSPVGVATLWTERSVVAELLKDNHYCVIGNLYSAAGISPLIRNVFAKPTIRTILLWGADLSRSGQALLSLMKNGVDNDYRIKGSEKESFIEREIDKKSLELFRRSVKIVNLRGQSVSELKKTMKELAKQAGQRPFSKVKVFAQNKPRPITFPSEQIGFRVEAPTTAQTWLKVLNNIFRFGRYKKTRYTQNNELKELLNLAAVVKNEDAGNFYFPHYLPFSKKELKQYLPQVLTAVNIAGIAYTYGQRLRDHDGVDQIRKIIDLIKRRPFSKKMAAFTAKVKQDWQGADKGDTPCLTQVLCSVQDDKLLMTAHFRSQDMVNAWPRNVFSLIKLQEMISRETGYERGQFCMITHSAHIYSDDYELVEKILKENYEKELGFKAQQRFQEDARGNMVIEIRNPKSEIRNKSKIQNPKSKKEIVVKLYAPDGGLLLKEWRGRTAKEVYWQITDWDYLTLPSHLVYIGTELQRAQDALRDGKEYVQDRA